MANLYRGYRILALIVGVLLTALVFVAMPLKYFPAEGSSVQQVGERLVTIVGVSHGWIYMAYLAVSFMLSRRAGWRLPFTLLVLLAGLVPILIFWVEHKVVQLMRREHPEAAGVPAEASAEG